MRLASSEMKAIALGLLAALLLASCTLGKPAAKATPKPSPRAAVSPAPASSPTQLHAPGPLHFNVRAVAQGLEAPWALDFGQDDSLWLTERPGRVRIVRNHQLLPDPALTLNVVSQPGCEGGLLGLAVRSPYVYLDYTYAGGGGNTDRVSRFHIDGDHLTGEQVLLDGIPGGACYHFGGRLKIGPDGMLYVTTGEGFVASRAADPNNLSGKILRLNLDGSGESMFAWGFRNPQGLAFDQKGRLYASNNGPSGDLGLCCHDSLYLVTQGGFHGWPAWAANVKTSYSAAGLPARTPPIAESGGDTWAPSGMTFYQRSIDEVPTLLVATLRGQALRRFILDPANPGGVVSNEVVLSGEGRLRDAVTGPEGCLYVLTSNRDGRGSPHAGDDRVLQLCPV